MKMKDEFVFKKSPLVNEKKRFVSQKINGVEDLKHTLPFCEIELPTKKTIISHNLEKVINKIKEVLNLKEVNTRFACSTNLENIRIINCINLKFEANINPFDITAMVIESTELYNNINIVLVDNVAYIEINKIDYIYNYDKFINLKLHDIDIQISNSYFGSDLPNVFWFVSDLVYYKDFFVKHIIQPSFTKLEITDEMLDDFRNMSIDLDNKVIKIRKPIIIHNTIKKFIVDENGDILKQHGKYKIEIVE